MKTRSESYREALRTGMKEIESIENCRLVLTESGQTVTLEIPLPGGKALFSLDLTMDVVEAIRRAGYISRGLPRVTRGIDNEERAVLDIP